jgi:hypothetical protein
VTAESGVIPGVLLTIYIKNVAGIVREGCRQGITGAVIEKTAGPVHDSALAGEIIDALAEDRLVAEVPRRVEHVLDLAGEDRVEDAGIVGDGIEPTARGAVRVISM